jgi:hypothetical protein
MENQPITSPSGISSTNSELAQPSIPPQTKTNLVMPIVLTLLVSGVIFGFGGYYLGKQQSNSQTYSVKQPIPSPSTQEIITTISPSPNSEKSTYSNQNFTFDYPKSWIADTTFIYEHRSGCNPDTFRCTDEKNIVDIRSNLTPIYQGYTNSEWFDKIAGLTTPWESGRDVFSKLATGKIQEGKNYVIFKQAPSANFEGEPLTLIVGYVLDNNNLYELRLSHFGTDQEGLNLVKSLIETIKVK